MERLCKKCGQKISSGESIENSDIRMIDELFSEKCNNCLDPEEIRDLNSWLLSCTCKRDG